MSSSILTKFCSRCKLQKPIAEFGLNRSKRDGHQCFCRLCISEIGHQRYAVTPNAREKSRQNSRRWNQSEKGKAYYRSLALDPEFREKKHKWKKSPAGMHHQKLQKVKKFGISIEFFASLNNKQNEKCAICGKTNGKRSLAIDHDHETGKVRGLLCGRCNIAIGLMYDNAEVMIAAANYLKSPPAM